jgi:ATP adenylyltransferase/5',5'''-P-1,P-4-tetraphosphate phosphorylase II
MPLLELVKPDKTKPARLYRDPQTGQIVLEYTGVDNNIYRVPVSLVFLPQEFADLAAQLTLADLFEMLRVNIAAADIIVPVDLQARLKSPGNG